MTLTKSVVDFNLQLFAEEATATAGENGTAPPAAEVTSTGENSSGAAPPVADAQTDVTSGTDIPNANNGTNPRLTFEELLKNKETEKEAKAYINKKFGERFNEKIKTLEDNNAKMREILSWQNMRYGLDPDSENYLDELSSKVQNDAKLFEDEALAAGMDRDTFVKVKQAEQIIARNKRDAAEREQQQIINNHFMLLRQQEAALKAKHPGFDLDAEMQNETFRKLVGPPALGFSGLPIEAAYNAIHYKDIQRNVASQALDQATIAVANSMAVNKARPTELVNAKTSSSVPQKSFKDLKKEDFEKIRTEFLRSGKSPF